MFNWNRYHIFSSPQTQFSFVGTLYILSNESCIRSVTPGLGPGTDGGTSNSTSATLPAHSPSLNSSHRSGSLPRPLSPSPSLTSDKNEQDFQVSLPPYPTPGRVFAVGLFWRVYHSSPGIDRSARRRRGSAVSSCTSLCHVASPTRSTPNNRPT